MLSHAQDATGRVAALADEAADHLAAFGAGRLNGFEIFADPSTQRAHLAKAARAATEALAVMDAVHWPSPADLDRTE